MDNDTIRIALAGNPNCGKTTLFNALTGSNQFVGNWPGVTVEKKEGKLKKHNDVIIDARSEERYEGKAQEPRKSLRVGHAEGAISVFFKHLLDDKGRYHSVDKIKSVFIEKGVDLTKDVIAYCGTGLTACIDLFALAMLGREEHIKLYDASWMEYGNKTLEEINAIKNNSV